MTTATMPLEQVPGTASPMRRLDRRRGRIVRVTVLFVTCICIALLAMNAWLIVRAHTAEVQQINRANSNLAHSVSQHRWMMHRCSCLLLKWWSQQENHSSVARGYVLPGSKSGL